MRITTDNRRKPGRLAALLMVTLLAAMVAIGYRVQTAEATGTASLSATTYTGNEGDPISIVVNKSGSHSGNVVFQLTFTGAPSGSNTAVPGGDYVDPGIVQLTFLPGESQDSYPLSTIEDFVNDGPKTLTVTLSLVSGDGALGAPTNAIITILDDDGAPTYSYQSSAVSFAEGAGAVTVTVIRSGSTSGTASVDCSVSGGSATGGGDDYSVTDGTANFANGAATATCGFTIDQDASNEGNETIALAFANPVSFGGGGVAPLTMTITITDDDGTGSLHFTSATYDTGESVGSASFGVTRTGGTTGALAATCGTTDLFSADPDVDYDSTPDVPTLNWSNGEGGTKYCVIDILEDSLVESPETFGLVITGDVSGQTTATVTIVDDDGTGTLQFSATTYTDAENGGAITVVVTRTGTSGTVTVDISTSSSGSTAGADVDYVADSGLLTFVNGDSSETWTIMPIDDAIVEGTEHFHVVLSNPSGGAVLGSPSTAQVNITDNESPLPSITDITPASGTILGGTVVTIYGVNFTGATSVTFGGYACTSLSVLTANTITCVTPAHVAGTVDVVVTTPAGSNSTTGTANDYTYTGGPTITSLSPDTGLANGTTVVTITGTGFTASGTTVRFDGIVAIHSFVDSEMLVAVAPAHSAGVVDVSVTTPGGTSPNTIADDFTYTGASVPVVTLLSPASGPIGTTVTIAGSGLTGATLVTFGGVAATFTVNSDAQITASVPSATPIGTVDVRVSTPSGTSANTAADNFNNTSSATTVTYTLFFRFTLIVWTGQNNIGALAALKGLENPDNPNTNNVLAFIGAIWRFDAATQTFKAYFPGSDGVPGANDFTTLQSGVGYFIALLNPGTVTWTTLGAQ